MNNVIEIHRPHELSFNADEHAGRELIYQFNLSKNDNVLSGMPIDVAERVFHILNAPEDMLSEVETEIANDFRASGNYSLSTGDIVKVDEEYFLCQPVGWKKIENPIYPLINHA